MKIALGTVQFGMAYGVANHTGNETDENRMSAEEAERILAQAKILGVDTLDTAMQYGDAEARLGKLDTEGFRIITKLPAILEDDPGFVRHALEGSLSRLGRTGLDGLMVHRADHLLDEQADVTYAALASAKSEGLVHRIGVSGSAPEEIAAITARYDIDVIQLPCNLFDRRLFSSGLAKSLAAKGVEIHVRSVFLQGLLLMVPGRRPAYFDKWDDHFSRYDCYIESLKNRHMGDAVSACLGGVVHNKLVHRVVVGVDTAQQLVDIGTSLAVETKDRNISEAFAIDDEALINPALWSI